MADLQHDSVIVAGEGNPGRISERAPVPIQKMKERLRLLHHPKSTEDAYCKWVLRLIKFTGDQDLEKFGEAEIGAFLTDLAVGGEVASGTQNQALSGSQVSQRGH